MSRIRVKVLRTADTGPPAELEPGEFAYSQGDEALHVGQIDGNIKSYPLGGGEGAPVDHDHEAADITNLATVLQAYALASHTHDYAATSHTHDYAATSHAHTWASLTAKPSTLAGLGVSLAVGDLPAGYSYTDLINRPDISALEDLIDVADYASLPATGVAGVLYITLDTGLFYRWTGIGYSQLTGRAAIWGEVSGSIANQSDLQALLTSLQDQITDLSVQVEAQKIKVGDLYLSTDATSPASRLGYGTWERYGEGRALVGVDSADSDFDTAGKTGGVKAHTLTSAEMPAHSHTVTINSNSHSHIIPRPVPVTSGSEALGYGLAQTGSFGDRALVGQGTNYPTNSDSHSHTATAATNGSGQAHTNLQPYIAVHVWRRTA